MSKYVLVEGRNSVKDALNSQKRIRRLMVAKESSHDIKVQEILNLAKVKDVAIEIIPSQRLKQIHHSYSSQNVLAEMEIPELSLKEVLADLERKTKDPFFIVINRLDYEHNLGAIMRTAWGAGVDAVIVSPAGVHEISPSVSKVAMGAAAYIPLIAESLFPALKTLKDFGIRVIGVESKMGGTYYEANLRGPLALLMGGEDSGLTEPLKKYCDEFVNIPLQSQLSSLNVSVAAAVVLFEKNRQEEQG